MDNQPTQTIDGRARRALLDGNVVSGAPVSDAHIHRDLVAFLGAEFARTHGRSCTEVGLFHAQAGTRGTSLHSWGREEDPDLFASLSRVEELASTMIAKAQGDATSRGPGRHRFEVRTTQHLGGSARQSFHLVVDPDDDTLAPLDDRTDTNGQIAQQMKHTEWAIRAMLGMVQTSLHSSHQQIRQLSEQNNQLYEDRTRMLAKLEAAQAEQDERTMAMVLAEKADDRKDRVLNKILPLAPVALARFMGKDSPPGTSAGALGPVIMQLVDTLNEAQIMKLVATFDMPQRVLFAEAMRIVGDMKAADKAAADKAAAEKAAAEKAAAEKNP